MKKIEKVHPLQLNQAIEKIENLKLKNYLLDNFKKLNEVYFTVTEILKNSVTLRHSFRNDYLTITACKNEKIVLILENFGGKNIRKIDSEILQIV